MLESRATHTAVKTHPVTRLGPRARADRASSRSTNTRPFFLLAGMFLCAAALIARLTFWQIMQHGHLSAMEAAAHASLNIQQAPRGLIYDTQGDILANNLTEYLIDAVPSKVKNPAQTAHLLAPVLHESERTLRTLLTQNAEAVRIAPPISARDGQKVRDLALPGILAETEWRRVYPVQSFASHLLGFTNTKMVGQYGLEGYYNSILSGTAGLRSVLKDTAGNDVHVGSGAATPAHNGGDLHLSIDYNVQGLVEDALNKAVKQHGAAGGTIIVMDPRTGYILGMASTPAFNPNQYGKVPVATLSNPATQWIYEPGSTMKILTMAAGLDSGVITPQSALDDTGSFVAASDTTLHNWNLQGFGYENMTQVLQHSANVGASWVAQRLGVDRFYTYLKRFHMGEPTGIDLQGEEAGLLPWPGSKNWTIVNLYTNSFGQAIAVTPMQLLRAISAVANGGVMMKPQVVKQIVYDGRIIDRPPVVVGRPISARTARTLTDMLVHSAIGGEAEMGLVHGYDIAAKTGTANIADGHGNYIKGATIASIVGFAPAHTPRFSALVIINRPRDTIWGSEAAAPVLHDLFQELFMYYHIPPSVHALYK